MILVDRSAEERRVDGGLFDLTGRVAVVTALEAFLAALPLVALGALLLWIRLRGNDRDYRVEGMLDL